VSIIVIYAVFAVAVWGDEALDCRRIGYTIKGKHVVYMCVCVCVCACMCVCVCVCVCVCMYIEWDTP
jgi:hypothetical protein